MTDVLFIDDDADLRDATRQSLLLAGLTVETLDNAEDALRFTDRGFEGVIVTDIRMPGMDGLELLRRLVLLDSDLPVILISGHADVSTAVGALKQGAYDVLAKPYPPDQLIASIERALERRRLVMENRRLRDAVSSASASPLIGGSPAIERLRRTIAQVASIGVDVLLQGETGTGKGLVADMLHTLSGRQRPMVTVDCGALPDALVESELFGHVSGAFAGAQHPRTGRVEQASRGTLFLDEIDAMRDDIQLKMQRVLERREITPLGANAPRALDLRVISASKEDLGAATRDGRFKSSLYYRVNGVTLELPPLRERREDVAILFRTFITRAAKRLDRDTPSLTSAAWRHLKQHDWPGNVRELQSFAEKVVLGLSDSEYPVEKATDATAGLRSQVAQYESQLIEDALVSAGGDVNKAMIALALPRKTFYDKIVRHAIDLRRYRH